MGLTTINISCHSKNRMKILLVDDEEAIIEVFKQALEQEQFEVITALNGTDGMSKARIQKPDVIFLDQVLPDMNGNDVLQQLKADPDTKRIPIAILSNFNQDTLIGNAMKMGASDYILKYQIAPHDLIEKAKQLATPVTPGIQDPTSQQTAQLVDQGIADAKID